MSPEIYNDDIMREAQRLVNPGNYDLIKNNCQDYADSLRDAYGDARQMRLREFVRSLR